MKRKLFLILLAVTGSIGTLRAQDPDLNAIDSFITYIEVSNRDIGNVSIYKDGKEIYYRSFGQQAVKGLAFDDNTRYQIGSITKTFTAVLLFQLIERNQLSLDDKLAAFFPDMPGADRITIQQLLEHSSGLADYIVKDDDPMWLTQQAWSEAEILDEIKRQGLIFQPGEKVEYSNSAYYLLTKILEKKYKSTYGKILEQHITKPCQLRHTQSVQADPVNTFTSYEYTNDHWVEKRDFVYINALGAGDIVSTTRDLNKFIIDLFEYKILKPETIAKMKPILGKEYFGRGLMEIPFYDQMFYGHGGDTKGTHSAVGYNEKDKIAFAFSINGERYPKNSFAAGMLNGMYNRKFDFPIFKEISLKPEELDQYLGVYSSPQLPLKVTISKAGNVLMAQGTGQPSFPLTAYDVNKFEFEQANVKLEFKPASSSMIFRQRTMEFEMKRE